MSKLATVDEDRKQLSELNEAFKNLYVNLYDDKYVKGERELRETKERATVPQQQFLSVSRDGKNATEVLKLLGKDPPLFFGSIEDKVEEAGNGYEAFKKVIHEFATLNSWLTSVLMDREEDGNIRKNVNNDEHAKPFPSMLVFGGGIAQIPDWEGKDKGFLEELHQNRAFAKYYLAEIEKNGFDITQFVKITKVGGKLMQILGYKFEDQLNATTLNYFGIYLSEAKINKEKNNVFFDKLVPTTDDDEEEEDGRMLKLMPRNGLIEAFVRESIIKFAIEVGLSVKGKGDFEKTKELLKGDTTDDTAYYNREEVISFDARTEGGKYDNLKKHLKNVNDNGKLGEYIQTATSNIKYIMAFLCEHYNKNLYKRTFLNCMLIKLMVGEPKPYNFMGKYTSSAHEDDGSSIQSQQKTTEEQLKEMDAGEKEFYEGEGESIVTKVTNKEKSSNMVSRLQKKHAPATPPRYNTLGAPSSQPRKNSETTHAHEEKDDYIDDFMKAYIDEHVDSLKLKHWFNNEKDVAEQSVKIREIFIELMGKDFWKTPVELANSMDYDSPGEETEVRYTDTSDTPSPPRKRSLIVKPKHKGGKKRTRRRRKRKKKRTKRKKKRRRTKKKRRRKKKTRGKR